LIVLMGITGKELEMDTQNLDIYGHEPIPWSRALKQLQAQGREEERGRTCWLATADPDGSPHVAAVGALWVNDRFYFTSGPRTRKSKNLAAKANCAISVSLDDLDVVVEGSAHKVTDTATLERVVSLYASLGWPARASGGAITAEYSAPSAGRGPWDLYAVTATAAVGVATQEPHGATRWRF
jgi:pyridoxine/pyridoxamine 5'-phosphate oxidase